MKSIEKIGNAFGLAGIIAFPLLVIFAIAESIRRQKSIEKRADHEPSRL